LLKAIDVIFFFFRTNPSSHPYIIGGHASSPLSYWSAKPQWW